MSDASYLDSRYRYSLLHRLPEARLVRNRDHQLTSVKLAASSFNFITHLRNLSPLNLARNKSNLRILAKALPNPEKQLSFCSELVSFKSNTRLDMALVLWN